MSSRCRISLPAILAPISGSVARFSAIVSRSAASNGGSSPGAPNGLSRSSPICFSSSGRQAEPLVAPAQPVHDRDGEEHHPGLADHLAREEAQAAEGEVEEHGAV